MEFLNKEILQNEIKIISAKYVSIELLFFIEESSLRFLMFVANVNVVWGITIKND